MLKGTAGNFFDKFVLPNFLPLCYDDDDDNDKDNNAMTSTTFFLFLYFQFLMEFLFSRFIDMFLINGVF